MYVHGCANPIKYLYLQGHFSKRDFREMSFLLWSNNIRMEESIMTDTALRAGCRALGKGISGVQSHEVQGGGEWLYQIYLYQPIWKSAAPRDIE